MMELEQLENRLRALLKGKYSSLSISFNESNGPNYWTVAEDDDGDPMPHADWISEEERLKARAENSCWTLQWYPNTPVGFCAVKASSLTALFEYVAIEEGI